MSQRVLSHVITFCMYLLENINRFYNLPTMDMFTLKITPVFIIWLPRNKKATGYQTQYPALAFNHHILHSLSNLRWKSRIRAGNLTFAQTLGVSTHRRSRSKRRFDFKPNFQRALSHNSPSRLLTPLSSLRSSRSRTVHCRSGPRWTARRDRSSAAL